MLFRSDRSAAPVGRFLCDLHGEDRALYPMSDALCNALQVINHLQDCAKDYAALDRVYLPLEWLTLEGSDCLELSNGASTPAMRRVLNRCVDGVDILLNDARKLPGAMRHRRLAAETAVIVGVAERLTKRLRVQDPLAVRVELGRPAFVMAALAGLARLWLGPAR